MTTLGLVLATAAIAILAIDRNRLITEIVRLERMIGALRRRRLGRPDPAPGDNHALAGFMRRRRGQGGASVPLVGPRRADRR